LEILKGRKYSEDLGVDRRINGYERNVLVGHGSDSSGSE
jgi:hypothetical protein